MSTLASRTEGLSLAIVCPAWCRFTLGDHLADMGEEWRTPGRALHLAADVVVCDPGNADVAPVVIGVAATSRTTDGVLVDGPYIDIEGGEMTPAHASAVAAALISLVEEARP